MTTGGAVANLGAKHDYTVGDPTMPPPTYRSRDGQHGH